MLIRWIIRSLWPRLWSAANKWLEDDGPTWAASLGYYAAFSFFPLILLLLSMAGFVLRFSHSVQLQERSARGFNRAANIERLGRTDWQTRGGSSTACPTKRSGRPGHLDLRSDRNLYPALEAAFGQIWHVEPDPNQSNGLWATVVNALYVRLRAFLMLLGTWALVLLAFIASLVVATISHLAKDVPLGPTLLRAVSMSVTHGLNVLCFALLYRFLPKRRSVVATCNRRRWWLVLLGKLVGN